METTNKTAVIEFVDKLFTERGVKFEKTTNGEYNIDGDIFLDDFPELAVDGNLIIT